MYVVPVAPVTDSLFPGKVLSVVNVDESVIIFIFILCFSLFFNLKNTEGRPRKAFSPGEDKSFLPLSPSYRRQTGHQFACLFFLIVFFYSFFFSIYWLLYIPSVFSTEIFLSRTGRLGADCGRKKNQSTWHLPDVAKESPRQTGSTGTLRRRVWALYGAIDLEKWPREQWHRDQKGMSWEEEPC